MAKAEQIIQLLKSHLEGDDERFYAVAMQVAAHEARQGHSILATELKNLIDDAKRRKNQKNKIVTLVQPKSELSSLLTVSEPKIKLSDLTFADDQNQIFERIILEFRQQLKLREHGLEPRRKLLLYGPPGTGKTVTASALARELHLPLYTIRLDGLITKYMGETAGKLRQVFELMRTSQGLYFFDEFDAIGSHRHSPNDVGEIRRILNSFLQFLEQDDSESLIVAATNYIDLLDSALFRRFDDVIRYGLPETKQVRPLIENRLHKFTLQHFDWNIIEKSAEGLSHAEISRACDSAAKSAILDGDGIIATIDLKRMLEERKAARNNN